MAKKLSNSWKVSKAILQNIFLTQCTQHDKRNDGNKRKKKSIFTL